MTITIIKKAKHLYPVQVLLLGADELAMMMTGETAIMHVVWSTLLVAIAPTCS